ncbi:hypothetical protein L226DRAFT_233465 [Lentinus tigrinus ALCF2SS1-7]|uniref:uncharacterized protein n=1 Tax=Lentinus tigrinus ALCF2SS1-7 TaxID=1328758 RepID=UPI001165E929|nr:hypothetical protein L226DRAFT_233465 [Lentinus tigrinus ALCF2SS1-7]
MRAQWRCLREASLSLRLSPLLRIHASLAGLYSHISSLAGPYSHISSCLHVREVEASVRPLSHPRRSLSLSPLLQIYAWSRWTILAHTIFPAFISSFVPPSRTSHALVRPPGVQSLLPQWPWSHRCVCSSGMETEDLMLPSVASGITKESEITGPNASPTVPAFVTNSIGDLRALLP